MKKVIVYWPVVLAVLLGAAAVGATQYAVDSNTKRIERLEEAISSLNDIRLDIKELLRRK